jgi:PhzF family phenazine biosynthesis protein
MSAEKANKLSIYIVDAFTAKPFGGNPAGVCVPATTFSDEQMQKIAAEMRHSETAFITPKGTEDLKTAKKYGLRWFTPACEVPLCGHATLAASHVLFNEVGVDRTELTYETLSGELKAVSEGGGIRLDFPSGVPEPFDPPEEIIRALGIEGFVEAAYCKRTNNTIILLSDTSAVLEVKPDFEKLKAAKIGDVPHGVIVTAEGDRGCDFVSRFFAPAVGIPEDPVTGVAHTVLTPFWAERLGKDEMRAYQASVRGGELIVRLAVENRVHLIGKAVTILTGELKRL